jgi:hypothetical protein
MSEPIQVNPLDRDKDVLGRSFKVVQCEAKEHGDNEGCVCQLIGREVTLTKRYETPFVGTATFHIEGHDKRVRLSELGLPNRMA